MTVRRSQDSPALLVAGLALAASASGLRNGFVYDDIPILLQNPIVHHLEQSARIWHTAYWPAGLLYRPATVQLFALEWAAGGGRSVVFHLTNVVLMMLAAVLFWRLARRLLAPVPALAASALFAVHPVHVESVANVVGQAELLATTLALLAVERYLAWREAGPLGPRHRFVLAAITILAILSKETGFVIPPLLVAAECLVTDRDASWRVRLRQLTPALMLQAAVVAAGVLLRVIALGPTPGAGPAVALQGMTAGERMIGMLAVVPEWARLLLWPAHLQAEYGPPAIPVNGPIGLAHVSGIVLLGLVLMLAVVSWRRHPVIAFGVAWVAIALFPVSNVVTVTGVILAERTLFLPSAGAMLAVGGALGLLAAQPLGAGVGVRHAALLAVGVLVMAGVLRSAERQLVWREQPGFIRRLESDGPDTYRAQLVASNYYSETGRAPEAERTARRAYALYKGDPQVFEQLGQTLRRQGRCGEALPVLADGVHRFPDRTVARSRLVECALAIGDTARALEVAREGIRLGRQEFQATVTRLSR